MSKDTPQPNPTPQPIIDVPVPPLKPGTDAGVYAYLMKKVGEAPDIRTRSNEDPVVRDWRTDLLYNIGNYFGTDSPQFSQINLFRAVNPSAFINEARRAEVFQSRHQTNIDLLAERLGVLMRQMEA